MPKYMPVSTGTPVSSQHIIHLKQTDRERFWQQVEAYREKMDRIAPARTTLDFASIIQKHNTSMTLQKPITPALKAPASVSVSRPAVVRKRVLPQEGRPHRSVSHVLRSLRPAFSKIGGRRRLHMPHFAVTFATLCLLVAVPFPAASYYHQMKTTSAEVMAHGRTAFDSLQSSTLAALNADIGRAQTDLVRALGAFEHAKTLIERDHRAIVYVAGLLPLLGKEVRSRQHLLNAGHHLALGNTYLVKGLSEISADAGPPTDRMRTLRVHLASAIPQYETALAELSGISRESVPQEYQASFDTFKLLFTGFIDDMRDAVDLIDAMQTVFGSDGFKRYLVVFQNHHELRPTGGFMGSFAVIDVQKGKIVNIDVPGGGTYAVKGQFREYLRPPLPLQLVNNRWEFQDANWFPHFPASAEQIMEFYEKSGGQSVDGVIAINASLLESILQVMGPVTVETAGVFSAETAIDLIGQEKVDAERAGGAPKEIIGTLATALLTQVHALSGSQFVGLLDAVHTGLEERDVQMHTKDAEVNRTLETFQWNGALHETAAGQDYLHVVNTNIGSKSDARMAQRIEHQAEIQPDGSIIGTVIIHRAHRGGGDPVLEDVKNISYLRVYVPEGSELLNAGGFTYPAEELFAVPEDFYADDDRLIAIEEEIGVDRATGTRVTREFGKTVFANWVMTEPGTESHAYFVYRLPFGIAPNAQTRAKQPLLSWLAGESDDAAAYRLLVQKQSGIESAFSSQILFPDAWRPVWHSGESATLATNGVQFSQELREDAFFSVVATNDE